MGTRETYFAADKYRNVEGILRVVRDGLCHRCGACIGVCPVGTFGIDDHAYPKQVDQCIECNICVRACSGLAVDYPALGEALFPGRYQFGTLMGPVRATCVAHAGEPEIRRMGASGGVITQVLAHWLETGRIKGALVAVEDPDEPSRGKGIIARTREDLLRSAQSRYCTAPSFSALYDIRDEDGPFAVVGLPCQIHSLRQRQMMDPRWKQRVPMVIGLLCHYNLPFESTQAAGRMLAPKGERLAHVNFRQRDERGWPHNTLEMTFTDGSKWRSPYGPAQIFNIVARVSPLGRCLMCLDATAEFSDFSIGDPWIRNEKGEWKYDEPGGWSSVIVRTAAAEEWLREVEQAGKLVLKPIPPDEVERGQHAMMT
ncbi:MAG: Coenzyme F420 hydrogenase/dehydrogenase, beta subunit C-terminal domain, partial [Verrucomicrobia bacterium]|nr:Coenzyme F420 hydrogenase/dehydrogenase, beta subunit C-terminal domain [Verrucomicrobiota bacterium]